MARTVRITLATLVALAAAALALAATLPVGRAEMSRPDAGLVPQSRPAARVTGVGGVFLKADDPVTLAAWYRDHMGVEVGDEGWARFRWREIDDPSREGATVWSLFPRSSDYFGSETATVMVNYRVDDLDRMLEQLRAAGAAVDDRIEEYPFGRFGWATDPEGNRLELWEPYNLPP